VIPSQVQSIDGSAFGEVNLLSCLIESDNRRFVIEDAFLLDVVDHRLIRNFADWPHITIPQDIELLGSSCFSGCQSLSSISFESNSQLIRIESQTRKRAQLNRFRGKSGRRRRTFARLRPFFLRSPLVALPLRPSVQQAARRSLPLFQCWVCRSSRTGNRPN
jgi:hypothetical protein